MPDLELDLPTGALIVGDASEVFADARPLVEGLPSGIFPVRAVERGIEVRLAPAAPVRWSEHARIATPSGYAALLDAAALQEYTDLGDEPVDEFELLAELFDAPEQQSEGAAPQAARFKDVLAVRDATGGVGAAVLALGLDTAGAVCRISLTFAAPKATVRPAADD